MQNEELLGRLIDIVGEANVKVNEPMSLHTTFKVGGLADFFITPDCITSLTALMKQRDLVDRLFILGNGSNLLVSDEGIRGIVLSMDKYSAIKPAFCGVEAEAGALLSKVASVCQKEGLGGMEFASGIPGSVGGACVMNAGAYGSEMKDVLSYVDTIDIHGETKRFVPQEMDLSYRHSIFSQGGYLIVGAGLRLKPDTPENINERMQELRAKRMEKQPLAYPSAGSTFKRPEGYFAAELIEKAGLKGCGVGDACVSEKHAGFIINKGSATATDIYETIRMTQKAVFEQFGVHLEPEVRITGEFR